MMSINKEIFDDMLIGNFMKTTIINKTNMNESKVMSTPMYDNKDMTKSDQPLEKLKEAEVNFQIDGNETKFRKIVIIIIPGT